MGTKEKKSQKISTRELASMALLCSMLIIGQVGMSYFPNIEVVSLFIYIYAQIYRKKVFLIIYVFVFIEGCIYGFGLWWFGYLYIWSILAIAVLLNKKKQTSSIMTSIILGDMDFHLAFCILYHTFLPAAWQQAFPTGYQGYHLICSIVPAILQCHSYFTRHFESYSGDYHTDTQIIKLQSCNNQRPLLIYNRYSISRSGFSVVNASGFCSPKSSSPFSISFCSASSISI